MVRDCELVKDQLQQQALNRPSIDAVNRSQNEPAARRYNNRATGNCRDMSMSQRDGGQTELKSKCSKCAMVEELLSSLWERVFL